MPRSVRKQRLDQLVVERGLVDSREKARALIMAGDVLLNERVVDKPGTMVPADAALALRAVLPYASRGGLKLAHALDAFGLVVRDLVALDVGASTGGFTDVLLQRGARRVYAVDVGYGQLDYKLRVDPRVVVLEKTNIRYLESLPEQADLATVDVSFISLHKVLPPTLRLLKEDGFVVALVKPQFEAGREQVGKGGVIRDPAVHAAVLRRLLGWAREQGLGVRGLTVSPLRGPAGNKEFLVHLARTGGGGVADTEQAIQRVVT